MSYLPRHTALGELTEEEAYYVDYELPQKRFELDKARFEREKRMAKWDIMQAVSWGVLPLLAFFGIYSFHEIRRGGS